MNVPYKTPLTYKAAQEIGRDDESVIFPLDFFYLCVLKNKTNKKNPILVTSLVGKLAQSVGVHDKSTCPHIDDLKNLVGIQDQAPQDKGN